MKYHREFFFTFSEHKRAFYLFSDLKRMFKGVNPMKNEDTHTIALQSAIIAIILHYNGIKMKTHNCITKFPTQLIN